MDFWRIAFRRSGQFGLFITWRTLVAITASYFIGELAWYFYFDHPDHLKLLWQDNHLIERLMVEFFERYVYHAQLIVTMLLVPIAFGTSFSKDRESKTLDQLLITSLSSFEIVLLTWLPRILKILLMGLSYFGLWSILCIRGWIAWPPILAIYLATIPILLAYSSCCLWLSARCRTTQSVLILGNLILLGFWFVTYSKFYGPGIHDELGLVSPILSIVDLLETHMGPISFAERIFRPRDDFGAEPWWPIISYQAIYYTACLFFLFMTAWELRHESGKSGFTRRGRQTLTLGAWWDWLPIAGRDWIFQGYATSVRRVNSFSMLLVLSGTMPFVLPVYWKWHDPSTDAERSIVDLATFSLGFITFLMVVMVGIRASLAVENERRAATWISLLTCPLQHSQFVLGKLVGCLQPAAPAMLLAIPLICTIGWLEEAHVTDMLFAWIVMMLSWCVSAVIGITLAFLAPKGRASLVCTILTLGLLHGGGQMIASNFLSFVNPRDFASALEYERAKVEFERSTIRSCLSVPAFRPIAILQSRKPRHQFAIGRDYRGYSQLDRWGVERTWNRSRTEQFPVRPAILHFALLELTVVLTLLPITVWRFNRQRAI